MKLVDILKEIATSHYTLSSPDADKKGSDINVYYYFTTDSGREYYVLLASTWVGTLKDPDQKYNWRTKLTFMPKNPYDTSDSNEIGGENFPKILGTVVEALKEYISTYKPEYIWWSGIPTDKEDADAKEKRMADKEKGIPIEKTTDPSKRQRIYNAILNKEAEKISGYKSKIGAESSLLYDGEIPIKDSHPLFKYPKKPTVKGNKEDEEFYDKIRSRFNFSRG